MVDCIRAGSFARYVSTPFFEDTHTIWSSFDKRCHFNTTKWKKANIAKEEPHATVGKP